ncbi:DDT domain-containing protein DDR4-like isoform X2 [Bidens hawaiensis]|uniref:DDT domain-containing protein DDR4-like isoform X2 n=1 Tax=Bidens hawaiensis TaxID=980011 RepID=UPI0040493327
MSDEHPSSPIRSEVKPAANGVVRRERPSRACTARSAARIYEAAVAEAAVVVARRHKPRRRVRREVEEDDDEEEEQPPSPPNPYGGIVTPLVGEPEPSQLPRWNIRSMWELASVLNFLNVFRPLLNIKAEFSVEELETALITPNNTLGEIHIPLLKAIPPVTRMALGQNTWVIVLCRKLRDWWHWVSEGELPIVASHGTEIETYKNLDPGVRVVILKALCDIRVEQDDIRSYIDDSIKHGVPLSAFRKERTGGDSRGVSFWYEGDPIIGQRLYREIRKVEVKKGKGKNVHSFSSYEWETVATKLDEFQDVSEKLFSSKNRMEASLGKKLKNDMLPEIEKVQKKKERLLKKQHREALLLDGMILDGLGPGRSLRGRKQVSYTFDDYDRSINEAIEITKRKQLSLEPTVRREGLRHDSSTNGRSSGGPAPATIQNNNNTSFSPPSPDSLNYDESDEDNESQQLDRSRRRQRPQRYSAREFVEAVSDNEARMDSDYNDDGDEDDIVGEAVYDEEYLKRKKERKMSSSSEGDEEYRWDDDNGEDEEDEDEGEESLSASENSDESPQRFKKLSGRTRRETKLRSVNEIRKGPRRSRRAARTRINYKQFEFSDSEPEMEQPETSESSDKHSERSEKSGFSMGSSDEADANDNNDDYDEDDDNENYDDNDNDVDDGNENENDNENDNENEGMKVDQPVIEQDPKVDQEEQNGASMKVESSEQDEFETGARKRRFLDLNELAPGSGFEDGPVKDDDTNDF